jgi:endonuclease-3
LVATILSAQSTDKTVNGVMPELLARYPTARALADAGQEEVEAIIKRTGFFRNKAKAIRGAAARMAEQHRGEVPRTLEQLVELPGVARKTANVVLGTAFRVASGVVVDTHVTRVAQRLGLTSESDPVHIEQDLCALFPQSSWIDLGHRFVLHGRYTCLARAPLCSECPLNELCPSRRVGADDAWEQRAQGEASRVAAGFSASVA